jgi:hypothetical protein
MSAGPTGSPGEARRKWAMSWACWLQQFFLEKFRFIFIYCCSVWVGFRVYYVKLCVSYCRMWLECPDWTSSNVVIQLAPDMAEPKLKLLNFVAASQVSCLLTFPFRFCRFYSPAVIVITSLILLVCGRRMLRLRAFRRRVSKSKKYMMTDRCTRLMLCFICTSLLLFHSLSSMLPLQDCTEVFNLLRQGLRLALSIRF